MSEQIVVILSLQAVGLLLAILVIWNYSEGQKKQYQKKLETALTAYLDDTLQNQMTLLEKDITKAAQSALKYTETTLRNHHALLTARSEELVTDLTDTVTVQTATALKKQNEVLTNSFTTQSSELAAELTAYRTQKIAEIDAASEKLISKLAERKVWRILQTKDAHAVTKAALQELLASGELQP